MNNKVILTHSTLSHMNKIEIRIDTSHNNSLTCQISTVRQIFPSFFIVSNTFIRAQPKIHYGFFIGSSTIIVPTKLHPNTS